MVLSGISIFNHPPSLILTSYYHGTTGKFFLTTHPPFYLPVSTLVLTGSNVTPTHHPPTGTNWYASPEKLGTNW